MKAEELIRALQTEIQRHTFDTFVDKPPAIAQGSKGVVISGCPACKKQFQSMNQFTRHLSEDVIPPLIRRLSSESRQNQV
jgi:hypothetical protein